MIVDVTKYTKEELQSVIDEMLDTINYKDIEINALKGELRVLKYKVVKK